MRGFADSGEPNPRTSHQSSGIRLSHERDPVPPRLQFLRKHEQRIEMPGQRRRDDGEVGQIRPGR
jgi:hypothetical protein